MHKVINWLEHWKNKKGPLFYLMLYGLLVNYKDERFSPRAIDDWNEVAGWFLYNFHDDRLALDASHKAIEIDEKCKESWYMEGVAYEEMGRDKRALSALSEAILLDGGYMEAREKRAHLYGKIGSYSKAHEEYIEMAQANNGYVMSWQEWGELLERHGKCSEAVTATTVCNNRCDDTNFWLSIGKRLSHNYLYRDQALEACDRAIACDSSNKEALNLKTALMEKEALYAEQLKSHAKKIV